ncbi:MAG: MaoC family dehydratase N-terminal domain-containing protein, partial [Chloroflexi bacterium]|nr:MaoC family dehydratase N-terminal domain-containing protein [Chloroflexota bacterium]
MSTASGNRITSELRAAMGRESAPVTSPDEISRSELRRHIQAIIEDDPIFWDEAAAKSRYGGLVCPGSFPITFTGRRPNGTP